MCILFEVVMGMGITSLFQRLNIVSLQECVLVGFEVRVQEVYI